MKYKNIFPEITVHPLIPNDFYDHKTVGEKFIQFAQEASFLSKNVPAHFIKSIHV